MNKSIVLSACEKNLDLTNSDNSKNLEMFSGTGSDHEYITVYYLHPNR